MKCTGVDLSGDFEWNHEQPHRNFCRCPICSGFLSHSFPVDKPFTCKKCKSELMVLPDDEESDYQWMGKICPLTVGGIVS